MPFKQIVRSKELNKGKLTEIYHDYDPLYFETQFTEIFHQGHYSTGRKKNAVMLDVGANIGLSVLYFKDYAKKIYAIEPNSIYFNLLRKNTENLKNVECFNLGLGIDNGPAYLMSSPGDFRAESIWGDINGELFQMMTIDEFFKRNKIEHIDVMKIDTEGSEYPIFMSKGFSKVADKIDYIIGEAHYKSNLEPHYIPEILKDNGFKVKFLPHKNMFRTFMLVSPDGKKMTKEYKVFSSTIFEAWKEK